MLEKILELSIIYFLLIKKDQQFELLSLDHFNPFEPPIFVPNCSKLKRISYIIQKERHHHTQIDYILIDITKYNLIFLFIKKDQQFDLFDVELTNPLELPHSVPKCSLL